MSSNGCLAYVFWHWIEDGADGDAYEDALKAFQEMLRAHPSPGLQRAVVFRHGPAPWLPGQARYYVDWYLTDGSAALDPLNEAAVSAACREAHAAAAEHASGGTAGLYAVRQGSVRAAEVRWATWFSKPAGISYASLDTALEAQTAGLRTLLFSRRMTLGPTPELCLLAASAIELPKAYEARSVPMELVWPAAANTAVENDPGDLLS